MLASTLPLALLVLAQDPEILPLGGGTAGFGGVPRIDLDGAPIVGRPLRIGLEDGLANSVAVLAASVNGAPVPSIDTGATTHLLPPFFAFEVLPLDDEGRSPKLIAVPVSLTLVGASFFVQGAVFDPAATGTLAVTEGIEFTLGVGGAAANDPSALFVGAALPPGTNPDAVELADLDGDGALDAIALLSNIDTVRTFLGDGAGGFTAFADASVGQQAGALELADLDGDGAIDAVVPNTGDATVSILRGNADGTFGVLPPIGVGFYPEDVAVADLDADGDLDLAVLCSSPLAQARDVRVLLGDGAGLFTQVGILPVVNYALGIDAGPVDADAHVDLVVAVSGSSSVAVYPGLGGGAFGPPVLSSTGAYPESVVLADLDGDGALDALTGNAFGESVRVLSGAGDGTFGFFESIPIGLPPVDVRLAFVDGDAHLDLVVGGSSSGGVTVALGTGSGGFGPALVTPLAAGSGAIAAGDLDGDGTLDLLQALDAAGALVPFVGNGDGSFDVALAPTLDAPFAPIDLRVVDANRDGIDDLFVVGGSNGDRLEFRAGLGGGAFAAPVTQLLSTSVRDFEFADMDGDGLFDLLVLSTGVTASLNVWIGAGDGSFVNTGGVTLAGAPTDLVAADLDGDGALDLAVSVQNGNRVAVFRGLGDGSFGPRVDHDVGQQPGSIAAGDLDGDGDVDLVAANTHFDDAILFSIFDAGSVSVLLNDGTGDFAPEVEYQAGPAPRSLRLADMDLDGALDIVALNWPWSSFGGTPQSTSVLLGNGDGSFGAFATYDAGVDHPELDVADLDGDLVPDLVVANRTTSSFALLRGVGDGSLEAPRRFLAGGGPEHLRAVDVTGDRLPDVLTLDWSTATVSVFVNRLVD